VVNKADREGADRSVRDLIGMLELRGPTAPPVEIVKTVASSGQGLDELLAAIDQHRARAARATDEKEPPPRRRKRAEAMLLEVVHDRLRKAAATALAAQPDLIDRVAARALDPYTAADELLAALGP